MRYPILSLTTAFLLLVPARAQEEGFVRLFDGKSLEGWEGVPDTWAVKDGAITCIGSGKKNWLIYRGGEFGNFILRLKFKFEKGNSGVQVRSREIKPFQVRGYQVEVASHDKMGLWHHSLAPARHRSRLATAGEKAHFDLEGKKTVERFAEAEKLQAGCKDGAWNDLEVIAEGNRLVQKINGVVFARLIDEEEEHSSRSGLLALQDHGRGTGVAFKEIRIKRLE